MTAFYRGHEVRPGTALAAALAAGDVELADKLVRQGELVLATARAKFDPGYAHGVIARHAAAEGRCWR